jgi:hypothetical protein
MKSTSSRVVVLLTLLLGIIGTLVDPPWSLWLGGIALSMVVLLLLGRWMSLDLDGRVSLRVRDDHLNRMRRRASRTAPAPRRLRASRPQERAFVPASDSLDEVETLAERIAARMKWDALWWFIAALAASIPIGIFVNHIS